MPKKIKIHHIESLSELAHLHPDPDPDPDSDLELERPKATISTPICTVDSLRAGVEYVAQSQ